MDDGSPRSAAGLLVWCRRPPSGYGLLRVSHADGRLLSALWPLRGGCCDEGRRGPLRHLSLDICRGFGVSLAFSFCLIYRVASVYSFPNEHLLSTRHHGYGTAPSQ